MLAAVLATALTLCRPSVVQADPMPLPYQQAEETAKTVPLSQDKQSAATNSSTQLPPLPTSFPLLPDIVVQAPQEVAPQAMLFWGHMLLL